jgi:hypothetical protein
MSAQILKVIPLSFIVCRFVHQKLRLVQVFHRLGTGAVELRDFVSAATGRLKQALGADWYRARTIQMSAQRGHFRTSQGCESRF